MNYADRLEAAVRRAGNPCLVGLDPHEASLPEEFAVVRDPSAPRAEKARACADFLCSILEVCVGKVPAVKPQSAFFEIYGADGALAWERVVRAARRAGLIVIGDVKRGDVPDTAKAYSDAHFYSFPADAITVNPFFGTDGMDPFIQGAQKVGGGLFVLVKTSNPKSGEIQDLPVEGRPLYMHLAEKVAAWGASSMGECGYSAVGAVVGATHPKQAAEIRAALPKAFFLVPGYGAQGGKAEDLKACFNPDGLGAVVNSSRGIISAWEKDAYKGLPWEKAVEKAVVDMKADINGALGVG